MGINRASNLLIGLGAGLVTGVAFALLLTLKERKETREMMGQAINSGMARTTEPNGG